MGQAAAMTGGYGNSYAQSVGQQAYNAQLDKLNDVIPELYQLAYDKYANEGQDLYNKYSLAADEHNRQLQVEKDKLDALNLVSPATTNATTEDEYYESPETVSANVDAEIEKGTDREEIKTYLEFAKNAGFITEDFYKALKQRIAMHGSNGGHPTM